MRLIVVLLFFTHLAKAETNPCMGLRPLSSDEKQRLANFTSDLSALDQLRPQLDNYKVTLNKIIDNNSPQLNTPLLKERAYEALIQEDFKNQISATIGLNSKAYLEFEKTRKFITDQEQWALEPIVKRTNELRQELINYYNSEAQKKNLSKVQIMRLEGRKIQAQTSLAVVEDLLIRDSQTHEAEHQAKVATYLKVEQGIYGAATFVAAFLGAGELVSGLTTAGGAAGEAVAPYLARLSRTAAKMLASHGDELGTILGGCAAGGIGSLGFETFMQAYRDLTKAWAKSAHDKTSFSCELRQIYEADSKASFKEIVDKTKWGTLSGCAVVGAAIPFPKLSSTATLRAVQFASVLENSEGGKNLIQAAYSYDHYREAVANLGKWDVPCEGPSLSDLHEAQEKVRAASASTKVIQTYNRLLAENAYQLAVTASKNKRFELAEGFLDEARTHLAEAGDHFLEGAVTALLIKDLKSELPDALNKLSSSKRNLEEGHEAIGAAEVEIFNEIPQSLGAAADEIGTMNLINLSDKSESKSKK